MRPTLFSAVILMLSALLVSDPGLRAAESAPSGGGSQKSGKRSSEGDKKSADKGDKAAEKSADKATEKSSDKAAAPNSAAPAAAEPVKRKPAPSKAASSKGGTEDERFAAARKAASEDPKVVELKEKADLAKTRDAGERAMRAYLRTLYGKMRTLEPSLEERIDLTEAAALKAISKGE